jgi:hypothetical protein
METYSSGEATPIRVGLNSDDTCAQGRAQHKEKDRGAALWTVGDVYEIVVVKASDARVSGGGIVAGWVEKKMVELFITTPYILVLRHPQL